MIAWSTTSRAFVNRSKSITTLTFPLFISSIHLSMMLIKAVWQEWFAESQCHIYCVSLNLYIQQNNRQQYLSKHIKKCQSVSNFYVRGKMSPYKLQTYMYIRTTCYIKTNWRTYLKTYVSVLGKIQSSTW
jgi:hypothetical protein